MARRKKAGRKKKRVVKKIATRQEKYGILSDKDIQLGKNYCELTKSKFCYNWKIVGIPEHVRHYMVDCKVPPKRNKDGRTLLYCLNRLSCKKTWLKPLLNFFYLPYITHNKSVVTGTPKYNYRVGLIFEILKDLEKIMIKQECGVKQAIQTLVKIKESEEELLIH